MWLRFTLFDVRVVAHYLGVLVSFFTIALAVPLVVAIAMQEWEPASRYLLAVGIARENTARTIWPASMLP